MTQNFQTQDPDAQRYVERMRELAERDPQIQVLLPLKAIQEATLRDGLSNAEIIAIVLEGYADRPALAERRYEMGPDPATGTIGRRFLPVFDAITYRELRERIEALASAWRHDERHRVGVDDFVCILGFTGIDFTVVDMATAYAQAVTVPLQTTLGATHLETILRDTAPATLVATISDLAMATELAIKNGAIRSVVAIDYDPRIETERAIFEAAREQMKQAGAAIHLTTLSDLIEVGRTHRWTPLPAHPKGLERLAALIHSSGSTGTPKGVMIPERAANFGWVGFGAPQVPTVGMAFGPMNHFIGRHQIYNGLAAGGTVYYTAKSDLSTLFEDIRLARPTFLSFFPRIFELIYQQYLSDRLRRISEGMDPSQADAEVRAEMGVRFLGDRLRAGSIGSAPCAPEVKQFMSECFDFFLIEGYGSTEGGIMSTMNWRIIRPHVIGYKLRDVPELGYYRSDKPYPRGELLVKVKTQSLGFFKRPEATAALFDEDGYVITGDIMEEHGPDHIVYIDRRNDVLKLSQAEFVAVGPLAATFEGGSAVMKQVYIYGNSARAYLLAVVVPDMDVVTKLIGPHPTEAELKALIRDEMQKVAQSAHVRTFEVPRDFIVEMEAFSVENGLLSSVRKRMRPKLKEKYGERLEAMYIEMERRRQDELAALKDPNSPLSVHQKLIKALEASLGIEGIDPETTLSFAQLGGDSLGTVSFSMFMEDIFGVELPVNAIISPAGNPRRWSRLIEAELKAGGSTRPTFARIHGQGAKVLQARDLDIVRFLDSSEAVPSVDTLATTKTVLLTGANGFLGRFLCLGWMERLAPVGGKVICLVRASNDAAARRRLDEVFSGVDPKLEKHYRGLAARHLEVLAGDIAEPGLGVTATTWQRLAEEVDHIVHPAALVNHVLSYEHLFGPNVAGSAELIRLALTKRMKRFDFVSSMAAAYRLDARGRPDEDSPLLESLTLGDGYADGYGASKWATEVQLHTASRRFSLPVNIYRGDMIMPHTRYHGQINVSDMITRLLYSIVMTELAPVSFYEPAPNGGRAKAHYDGLPVDFIAGAMIGIGAEPHGGIRTHNVINHHTGDGISLDAIVDWVESDGYRVERVEHALWLKRCEEKLHALTEAQRQHSSIAILHQFSRPFPAQDPEFGCEHFIAAVRRLPIGPDVPHLTEAYIHKYLDDMRRLNLIGPPPSAVVHKAS